MAEKITPSRRALESVEEMRSQVGRRRRAVTNLRSRCGAKTSRWGSGGGGTDGHGTLWESLADQSLLLEKEEAQLRSLEEQIEGWIDLLPKPRWRMVLRCRYLDGIPLGDIPQELTEHTGQEFSIYQVYRFHRQALEAADKLWPLS